MLCLSNDPDYIPNLVMGYGDDSLPLKLSLKKKAVKVKTNRGNCSHLKITQLITEYLDMNYVIDDDNQIVMHEINQSNALFKALINAKKFGF